MSVWRSGSHECEPASSHSIPLRYSIGRGHTRIEAYTVHEVRFGHQSRGSGSQHAGQFLCGLLTSALVLALMAPVAGFAQERTSADAPTSPAPPQAAPIGPPAPEGQKQLDIRTFSGNIRVVAFWSVT
jgi:hypothetical protein